MLFTALERYLRLSGTVVTDIVAEEQGSDYESGRVTRESRPWRIRTARVTPTKPGAFLAVWQRSSDGGTEPFGSSDECDGLMVFVEEDSKFGIFTFTRSHLEQLDVLRSSGRRGKRGFRVYPSWCTNLNGPATAAQRAQAPAFTALTDEHGEHPALLR